MRTMNGQVEGQIIAKYRNGRITLTCKISNGFYCVEANVRQTNRTHYSKDKDEMNAYIKKAMEEGFRRVAI